MTSAATTTDPHVAHSSLQARVESYARQRRDLLADPDRRAAAAMPGNAYVLNEQAVLAEPRDNGDSRYPFGADGFNFWVYASGYMHSNEGLFSQFLRAAEGQEPTIAFFAALPNPDGTYTRLPLLSVPRLDEAESADTQRYTVLTSTAAYFITETLNHRFAARVMVTADKAISFSTLATVLSGQPQDLILSSYFNPFLRNQLFESGEDRWFKQVQALPAGKAPNALGPFMIGVNEDKDRTTSITNHAVITRGLTFTDPAAKLTRQEQTASRYQYVGGSRSSLHSPASLKSGTFGDPVELRTFIENSIAGTLTDIHLPTGATARLDTLFRQADDRATADAYAAETPNPEAIDAGLVALEGSDTDNHAPLTFQIGDNSAAPALPTATFNGFVEHLKRQVDFCAQIKGYVQLAINSLIGIRDVFQALEATAFWRPAPTRAKMLEALGYTAPDGRCFRQYSLPSTTGAVGRMDLRPFIDQGCWVVSAVHTYLRATGDFAFLDEPCGYHEILDESTGKVRQTTHKDSVLDHLVKILDYMLNQRDHAQTGCVRALFGDWNDALDGLGTCDDPKTPYGTGVTVMATLQVYQNCHELASLLQTLENHPERARHAKHIKRYHEAADSLAASLTKHAVVRNDAGDTRLVHGWGDKRSYLVGSFKDPDGHARDGLTSNAFWVLAGMLEHDPSIAQPILAAFDRLDSKYGYKTFEPYFAEDAPGVGRIRKLPAGTAENAATYVHATAFAIMALFQMGRPKQAWDQLTKVLPFTDIHANLSHSPFVMPNSYGENTDKNIDGQCMNDWQTGSSNVILKLLIRYVAGFEPNLESLTIQPAAWAPFETFNFTASARGNPVTIQCDYTGKGPRTFSVNGTEHKPEHDTTLGLDKLVLPYTALGKDGTEIRISH